MHSQANSTAKQAKESLSPSSSDPIPNPLVDIIIPARDEQENIPQLFSQLNSVLADAKGFRIGHIIVVDNGSTDATAMLAKQAGAVVLYEARRGYGAACQAGIEWIGRQASKPLDAADQEQKELPDMIAFLDADLSDDPAHLSCLIEPIAAGRADLVLAARPRLAEPGSLGRFQKLGNALACALLYISTGKRYRDLGPMRVMRHQSLLALNMHDRSWGWTIEMQYKAAVQGLAVLEIDVPYQRRHAGRSKISGSLIGSIRAGIKMIYTIAKLRWQCGPRSTA
jgi:glycosyltransferase involved in cell wall biosynthesis